LPCSLSKLVMGGVIFLPDNPYMYKGRYAHGTPTWGWVYPCPWLCRTYFRM